MPKSQKTTTRDWLVFTTQLLHVMCRSLIVWPIRCPILRVTSNDNIQENQDPNTINSPSKSGEKVVFLNNVHYVPILCRNSLTFSLYFSFTLLISDLSFRGGEPPPTLPGVVPSFVGLETKLRFGLWDSDIVAQVSIEE